MDAFSGLVVLAVVLLLLMAGYEKNNERLFCVCRYCSVYIWCAGVLFDLPSASLRDMEMSNETPVESMCLRRSLADKLLFA